MIQRISWKKAILGIIISVAILIIAQLLAQGAGMLMEMIKIPEAVTSIFSAIIYPLLTFSGLKIIIERWLKIPLNTLRFKKIKINIIGIMTAILLPVIVVITYFFMQGEWIENDMTNSDKIATAVTGICFYSIAAGIVEEMVFRGVIMGLLEKWTNIRIAVLVPSVLFGLLHIIGNNLDFFSIVQLVIAGTVVGILFSLIACYYDSFWNNALVHAFWNASTIGVMHIGTEPYENSIYTYVLKSESMMITGGDFGVEASVISIIAYLLFIGIILFLIKRSKAN